MSAYSLIGKVQDELQSLVKGLEIPVFKARQIASWLYRKRVSSIDEMTDISLAHREQLKAVAAVGRTPYAQLQKSADGTLKYLFPVSGNKFVETVYIPDKERATLCVSTQVGCKMNCRFCMTGKQGFSAQLSSAEMMNQILSIPESENLTNIVFMGMGEPLDNLEALFKVLEILTSESGFAWSPKRITVSTIGLIPALKRFLDESPCHLAVSIHSPFPEERLSLMPVEKIYPIEKVTELIRQYDFSHQRRVSFEYILFGGLNDDLKHAQALARLLHGIPCRVNLIKYHAIPGVDLPETRREAMAPFRDYLSSKGIISTIRASRGEDILAACGMLSTKKM
ncbi:putative dual-specificity RNA methyltransferase RlmN [Bacteroidia bacterium]|nr:putative dual-specificity RNA methyltransferase RlmN [Bacteroidia bacterium]GHT61897.1 putative dual-specificity RNA methyltransferase RlmN [Bacteroidia bacterium]